MLEIEVKGVKRQKHLYDFRGNAFLRRDGSLQGPLKARQVQEWTRMVRVIVSFCSDQDGEGHYLILVRPGGLDHLILVGPGG